MAGPVTGWSLRPTVADDEEFLWQMLFYASHSNDEAGARPSDVKTNQDLVGYIEGWRSGAMMGVVAETAGEPLGAAWLREMVATDRSNPVFVDFDTPELAVAVDPEYAGRGVGTAMMEELTAMAAARFPAIVLSSRAENPAVRLYERLGFRIVEEITNRVGTRSVKMILDLRSSPSMEWNRSG